MTEFEKAQIAKDITIAIIQKLDVSNLFEKNRHVGRLNEVSDSVGSIYASIYKTVADCCDQ